MNAGGVLPHKRYEHGQNSLKCVLDGTAVGKAGSSRMAATAKLRGDIRDIKRAFGAQIATHQGLARHVLQEKTHLDAHDRAHHVYQAIALVRRHTQALKILGTRIAIGHATMRRRTDAAHNQALKPQVLQALALVDLKRNLRRICPHPTRYEAT